MPTLFDGETPLTDELVRSLVDSQCPQWRGLPLRAMTTSGTEHTTYRLGDELLVRVPRDADAETGLRKEVDWLPRLRGRLPLEVPVVEHVGAPTEDYPHTWTVNHWIDGEDVAARVLAGDVPAGWADTLAATVSALREIDLDGVPQELWPRGSRGGTCANAQRAWNSGPTLSPAHSTRRPYEPSSTTRWPPGRPTPPGSCSTPTSSRATSSRAATTSWACSTSGP